MTIKTAILTISTRGSRGERAEDTSGDTIRELINKIDSKVIDYQIIPDDRASIVAQLKRMVDVMQADLVLTTGGTGLSATDITPEATLEVIERRLPGFEEAMRMSGFRHTPYALLSRAVVGTYKNALIINLPGSPKGVRENLETVLFVIPHGIKVLKGTQMDDSEHLSEKPT